jgi:hypothetical protein
MSVNVRLFGKAEREGTKIVIYRDEWKNRRVEEATGWRCRPKNGRDGG